ncbi:hypothetical protein T484DRAFT_1834626 [Baffinella frigidus]|nr:hypothetical protein T484DRAFT_1834626 [Cryptophyta sp. CCMP2293]
MDTMDELERLVKEMRSSHVDVAMLEQVTHVLEQVAHARKNFQAIRPLGDSSKSKREQHDYGLSAAVAVRHNHRLSDCKPASFCLDVKREPSLAFRKVRQVDELAALRARARRGLGAREVRSADVNEVEQAMILKGYKARAVNSSKHFDRAAGNNDEDLSARHHLDRTRHASCPCVSSPPMLEFKVLTVSAPDFDWLNDREGFEEQAAPAARIFRKTPIPERAPPREPETIKGASCDFPPKGAQLPDAAAKKPNGRRLLWG